MGRAFQVREKSMAKTAAIKTKIYSKYGKELYMAAKSGIPDPEVNIALKRCIEKAKKDQVPADVIKRAIEKAKGGSEENYSFVRYEGFGAGNSLVIVDCLTDNVNRTVSEVRNCFTKTGGKLGVSGSVLHMFVNQAIFTFQGKTEEEVLEALIADDCNAEDILSEEEQITVIANPNDFYNVKTSLQNAFNDLEFIVEEITFKPLQSALIEGEDIEKFEKLLNMLEEIDDVQTVYHNAEINE